jgi:AraC-like DNA-binding protein
VHIPPLAFGQASAKIDRSVNEMQDRMATMRGWNTEYNALIPGTAWECRVAGVQVNGTKLVAVAHAPTRTKVMSNASSTVFVPIHGQANVAQINRSRVLWNPGEHAAYAPQGERIGDGGYRSVLMIDIDRNKMLDTIATMSGRERASLKTFDFDTPSAIALTAGNISFDVVIRNLCATMDSLGLDPQLLGRLGLDDMFYRVLAMMFEPKLFLGSTENIRPATQGTRGLDQVCQYVMAHLERPITLTQLEQVASLSRRALQYAFLKKFGCTPMQWVRTQRINLAHQRLLKAGPDDTVTSIALSSGFNSLSMFARYYQMQFGMLPSETCANSNSL